MDLQDDFSFMFAEDGIDLTIDGIALKGFDEKLGPVMEPYYGDSGGAPTGPFVIVQRNDLEDLGQWPLNNPVVVIAAITYRVVRHHDYYGHVVLYIEET